MTEPDPRTAVPRSAGDAVEGNGLPIPAADVNDLVQQIVKAARAHQIYDASNPVYQRFVSNLREAFARTLERISELRFELSDEALVWEGHSIVAGEGKENLAFLFFRDGVRGIAFLPGFEEEVEKFLAVVHRGRHGSRDSEDLLTLLWEGDFQTFRYEFVDQLAQGIEIPDAKGVAFEPVSPEYLDVDLSSITQESAGSEEADLAAEVDESAPPAAMGATAPVTQMDGIVRPSDFRETLYFLDDDELRAIQAEVRKEMEREVKIDVLNALFDRLEEPHPRRQKDILDILRQLLPSLLGRGDMHAASRLLVELRAVLDKGAIAPELVERADALFDELSNEESLQQLVRALEDGVLQPDTAELGIFFMHLRPAALPMLLGASWKARDPGLRARMEAGLDAVGRAHPAEVVRMLDAPEPEVAAAAAALAARLGVEEATAGLGRLMTRAEPEVRLAAVEAAIALHSGASMTAVQAGLDDSDREVRMAAAKGLARYKFQPARARVEQVIRDRIIKESDRTERVLFFEAYAQIGGPDAVEFLDGVLNARGLMGYKHSPELRACAARALALVPNNAAKESLKRASTDKEVVVRTEVARALRGDVPRT